MTFGVIGLIIATLIAGIPSMIWGLRFINKTYGISVDWSSSMRILLLSGVAGIVTFGLVSLLSFSIWIELLLGVGVFVVVLVPAMLFTRAITKSDVGNLKSMIGGLGTIGGLIGGILNLLEKIIIRLKL